MADVVTAHARGAGVAELIDRLIRSGLEHLEEASPLADPKRSD
jgi:hypothetical protein